MEPRFTALRLIRSDTLLVKEINLPVSFKLHITDPLTDAQMRILATASPFNPLTVGAQIGSWNDLMQGVDATITVIETPPKLAAPKHTATLRWGLTKRKRGFFSHD
jgi:hypothetical protein